MVRTRTIATLAAAAALAGCTPPEHVVLVHGAFMGAWAWEPVAIQLRQAGEKVSVVELPAHGADRTPVQDATLEAYVDKVAEAVEAEGPPVVLVGHSMGGMVISQYAERSPETLKSLVYLAALLPEDGQSLLQLSLADPGSLAGSSVTIDQQAGLAKLPEDMLQEIFCSDCSAEEAATIQTHYRDEPVIPLDTRVHLTQARWGSVPRWYLFTTADKAVSPGLQHEMTEDVALAGTQTLPTSHMPQLSEPQLVTDALEKALR